MKDNLEELQLENELLEDSPVEGKPLLIAYQMIGLYKLTLHIAAQLQYRKLITKYIEFHFRVNADILKVNFRYFDVMFRGPWKESKELARATIEQPFKMILTSGEDPAALLLVLNMIYGKFEEVPNSPAMELLFKVAFLVDYYVASYFGLQFLRNGFR